jgi:serine/threonine-protein kinase
MPDDLRDRLTSALGSRYEIQREIGSGGMAVVFLARDLEQDRHVALKVVRPELADTLDTDRFLSEMRVAAELEHPNVLRLIEAGKADGLPYYVMPYVGGENLGQRLEREGGLPAEEALRITTEVADGLDYVHHHGVVHRDLKPTNILLSEGRTTVTDFGLARAVEQAGMTRDTVSGQAVGTPAYMSPEQVAGSPVDSRADIYALGCVVFEMLVGQPPLEGHSPRSTAARRRKHTPTPVELYRPSIPPGVDDALARALDPSPVNRYGTAREFVDDFGAALAEVSAPGYAAKQADRAWPGVDRRTWWRAFAFALAVVVLIVVAMALWQAWQGR